MLLDDREKYSVGGVTKSLSKLVTKLNKQHAKKMAKKIDAVDNTQYFDFNDAIKMLEEGDITIAQANQLLKQAGYTERQVQQFTKAYSGLIFDKKAKPEDPRLKDLTPPTDEEIDKMLDEAVARGDFKRGGLLDDDRVMYKEGGGPGIEALRKVAPEVVKRMGFKKGGLFFILKRMLDKANDGQYWEDLRLESIKAEEDREGFEDGGMLNDDAMEDNYTRFIMDEALTEEEEDMLMSKLEQDEELAMIFDKVIDVAQEFAGSGPVEGPGSGVSDSIPARLSDGEFVFTAKAVEEIGEDTLMSMMKDAEAAADERQGFADGEIVEQESKSILSSGVMQEDEIAEDELKKRMVQGSSDYVRS